VLATKHNSTALGYTTATDPSLLFSGNNSCILGPDVTQGPYYVGGEYIRDNIAEDQAGLATYLDYQIIDVETCEPVPSVYVEIWHCNATGVYSGVVASGNGAGEDDPTNIDNTFLRGIQLTDDDGVAQFESVFPGHYTGRTTHVHVMVHTNAHVYENGTLGNEVSASHVGQAFFDQDLIHAVEATETYNSNTQDLTLNADDGILAEEADTIDPLMAYTLLGPKIEDGVFAWLAFGINVTASSSVTPAAFLYEDGGVTNENADMGGPGGGGGAGAPPGASMSGSMPPAMPTSA
jgi:protocatechuate 3,4-dioxygenase beta subunit